jgi:hypothetical protein
VLKRLPYRPLHAFNLAILLYFEHDGACIVVHGIYCLRIGLIRRFWDMITGLVSARQVFFLMCGGVVRGETTICPALV